MASSEDAASVLQESLLQIENLPSEVRHYMTEMRYKELNIIELKKNIKAQDAILHKHIKLYGSLIEHSDESEINKKIRELSHELMKEQQAKLELGEKIFEIIDRHAYRIGAKIKKLESEGLLISDASTKENQQQISLNNSSVSSYNTSINGLASTPNAQQTNASSGQRKISTRAPRRRESSLRPMPQSSDDDSERDVLKKQTGTSGSRATTATRVEDTAEVYCFCQQVSYGEMVACDDPECLREWFHLECVGLKSPPSGKWFCSGCIERHQRS